MPTGGVDVCETPPTRLKAGRPSHSASAPTSFARTPWPAGNYARITETGEAVRRGRFQHLTPSCALSLWKRAESPLPPGRGLG